MPLAEIQQAAPSSARQRDSRVKSGCLSCEHLECLANRPLDELPPRIRKHFEKCLPCSFNYSVFRSARCLCNLPPRWIVDLGPALRLQPMDDSGSCMQILGRINLETRVFEICRGDDWRTSLLDVRVNVVIDPQLRFWSITLLDAPDVFERVGLRTQNGIKQLQAEKDEPVFELTSEDEAEVGSQLDKFEFDEFFELVSAGRIQLVVDMHSDADLPCRSKTDDFIDILELYDAIERDGDYELPSGKHSDTFINVTKLCASEETLELISAKLDFLFWDTHFDTVLANGWAMSMIARRLADARQRPARHRPVHEALCEGYESPILLDDIMPGSRVLILVDVVVTGKLVDVLRQVVRATGATVVGVAVLVKPHAHPNLDVPDLRYLCEIEMDVVDPKVRTCQRCGILPKLVYNPVSACMTTKVSAPRSPSEFLAQDNDALEFWGFVDEAGAYEHHRKEGNTHYVGFIDTKRLLETKSIGEQLVGKLVTSIADGQFKPDVLVVPSRPRARLLAEMLARRLSKETATKVKVVIVQRQRINGRWQIPENDQMFLFGKDVLIVDSAMGHGRTVDRLATLVKRYGTNEVGAAVILSRLLPSCEDVFRERFDGHFHRLYSMPVRPIAIRGTNVDLCPVCQRKRAIRRFAEESKVDALEQWAETLLTSRRMPDKLETKKRDQKFKQRLLFETDEPFLSKCSSAVASGVTLHTLGAASTNGSAPLALPELSDESIPWRSRAAMVENLPAGVLNWAEGELTSDLISAVSNESRPAVWKASANFLSREGSGAWLEHLGSLLNRLCEHNRKTSESFWNHMACNAFLLTVANGDYRAEVLHEIETLLGGDRDQVSLDGLLQIQEALFQTGE